MNTSENVIPPFPQFPRLSPSFPTYFTTGFTTGSIRGLGTRAPDVRNIMHDNSEEPTPPDDDSIVPFLRARMRQFLLKATGNPELVRGWMREYDDQMREDNKKLAQRQGSTPAPKDQLPLPPG